SQGNDVEFEWIEEISLGSLTNLSGPDDGYGDFTGSTFQMRVDTAYSLTLTPGYSGFAFNEAWRVWIDLNQDGQFQDSSERVFGTQTALSGPVNGQIMIPAGTPTGITRMRISMKFGGFSGADFPLPCETFAEGEVEDYCIEITDFVSEDCEIPKHLEVYHHQDSSTVTLYWEAVDDAVGYQVRFQNLTTGALSAFQTSSDSLIISGLSTCTKYTFQVRSMCDPFLSSYSQPLPFFTKGCGTCLDADYCQAKGLSTENEWLRKVEIDTISYISGNDMGYRIFDNIPFVFQRVQQYPFHMEAGYSSGSTGAYWQMYADWNQDGTFDQVNEQIFSGGPQSDSVKGYFTVPGDAKLGKTRLRIMIGSDTLSQGCGDILYGEVEDYCITVDAGVGLEALSESRLNIYPNPTKGFVYIESDQPVGLVKIINLQGKEVFQQTGSIPKWEIDLTGIASGVYFIQVRIRDRYFLRKLMIY
ncbi:MAG: T9SS type A sorting domain-containing protein, partial [Bacteroidetes bacterium]|nr:T9SS type A sorting domain-containing protein [Bacteroidota bacterium]